MSEWVSERVSQSVSQCVTVCQSDSEFFPNLIFVSPLPLLPFTPSHCPSLPFPPPPHTPHLHTHSLFPFISQKRYFGLSMLRESVEVSMPSGAAFVKNRTAYLTSGARWEREREREGECVCVCEWVCVCVRESVCVWERACVCVRERVCVWERACVCERERVCVRESVCVWERACEWISVILIRYDCDCQHPTSHFVTQHIKYLYFNYSLQFTEVVQRPMKSLSADKIVRRKGNVHPYLPLRH